MSGHITVTSEVLKNAVLEEMASQSAASPGKLKAINFASISSVLDSVDAEIQKFLPAVGPLLPAQVQAIAGTIATIVHALAGNK